jgi:hypothetical protein
VIDRTDFDLRIAKHRDVTTRANATGWMSARLLTTRRSARARLAALLLALAARLEPATVEAVWLDRGLLASRR